MKKFMTLAAIAALALTACAKFETEKVVEDEPVAFGVYAGNAATKATYGDITTDSLKTSADGFGVFGYYTLNNAWAASYKPNFMYNQKVAYDAGANTTLYPAKWVYTPLKYWPNGQNATEVEAGTINDKVSFFAYAPRIAVDPETGVPGTPVPASGQGITAITDNDTAGAPTVTFTVPSKPEEQIDLLWANPMKDQTKQSITGTVAFVFNHALAKLNVKVQAVVDAVNPTTANLDSNTKIILESLELKAAGTKTGTLSLNDGNWSNTSGETDVTYNTSSFSATTTVNGKTGFNVTEAATALNTTTSPMIIPGTVASGSFVIVANYWVITTDSALKEGYSTVQNNIRKSSTAAITFAGGTSYEVLAKLGLTNTSFTVTEVGAWTTGAAQQVDLPVNTN